MARHQQAQNACVSNEVRCGKLGSLHDTTERCAFYCDAPECLNLHMSNSASAVSCAADQVEVVDIVSHLSVVRKNRGLYVKL